MIDWDKVADKFNVGVNVDDNNTVVGVNDSDLCARLDSLLPFPPNDSGNFFFDLPWVNVFIPLSFGMMINANKTVNLATMIWLI